MSKKVLLAVDRSDSCLEAVRYISNVTPFQEMQLVLFSVFSKIHERYWDLEWDPQYLQRINELRDWEGEQEKALEQFMKKSKQILLDAGFPENVITVKIHEMKKGIARDIISEAQDEYSAVVIGRKGMSNMEELVLGSVATKLLEKITSVPLIVVGKDPRPGNVLLALDGSEGSMRAVDCVGNLLGGSDFEVRFIHVIRRDTKKYLDAAIERIAAVFVKAEGRLLRSGFESRQVTNKIIQGVESRAAAIVQEAREGGYGTIVVGRRGVSMVKDFFIGRVSNKVIQLARDQAVWVV